MRYLLITGALAFSLVGTTAISPAASDPVTGHSTAATQISTASTPASRSVQSLDSGPGTPVESPDVAEWTATLVRQERRASFRHLTVHHEIRKFASRLLARTSSIAKSLTVSALRFLGTPYVFGGTSGAGFDCSGFVQHVFALMGVHLPRTADAQYEAASRARGGIKPGDLVFFQTYESGPSHVGIYIGQGKFVHASSSRGVMVSTLSDEYWSSHYIGAKRVFTRR